jgi:hypothetical protein
MADQLVRGISEDGWAVDGESKSGVGIRGISETGWAVDGESKSGVGIRGISETGWAVDGESKSGVGIRGISEDGWAVDGESKSGVGIRGMSETGWAIDCESTSGIGLRAKGGSLAGLFLGDVEITGDIRLTNADCAEDFDIAGLEKVAPGTVMVIDSEGALCPSEKAYDKRVAGVISGAGKYKPGIILDKQESSNNRMPIALMGKVFCKVDAQYGAIEVGDLLTTSPTPGHAMQVDDPFKALGTIIGKALRPLANGQGLIPILIALQ